MTQLDPTDSVRNGRQRRSQNPPYVPQPPSLHEVLIRDLREMLSETATGSNAYARGRWVIAAAQLCGVIDATDHQKWKEAMHVVTAPDGLTLSEWRAQYRCDEMPDAIEYVVRIAIRDLDAVVVSAARAAREMPTPKGRAFSHDEVLDLLKRLRGSALHDRLAPYVAGDQVRRYDNARAHVVELVRGIGEGTYLTVADLNAELRAAA